MEFTLKISLSWVTELPAWPTIHMHSYPHSHIQSCMLMYIISLQYNVIISNMIWLDMCVNHHICHISCQHPSSTQVYSGRQSRRATRRLRNGHSRHHLASESATPCDWTSLAGGWQWEIDGWKWLIIDVDDDFNILWILYGYYMIMYGVIWIYCSHMAIWMGFNGLEHLELLQKVDNLFWTCCIYGGYQYHAREINKEHNQLTLV
jgi:hypothetical protein